MREAAGRFLYQMRCFRRPATTIGRADKFLIRRVRTLTEVCEYLPPTTRGGRLHISDRRAAKETCAVAHRDIAGNRIRARRTDQCRAPRRNLPVNYRPLSCSCRLLSLSTR
jgi:hypothetical protein